CVFQASTHLSVGEMDEALALGNRALAMVSRLDDLRLQIITRSYLEQMHYLQGDHERVVELAIANLAALPADAIYDHFGGQSPVAIAARCWLVRSLADLGRFPAATKYPDEAISLAGPTQRLFTDAAVHQHAASLYLLQGDWSKALSMSEHGAAISRTGNLGYLLRLNVAISAWAQAQLGRRVEALDLLGENRERIEVRDPAHQIGLVYLPMGHAHLLLGQLDEAERLADRFVKFNSSQLGFTAYAYQLLGDIATDPNQFNADDGEANYRKALAL